MNARVWTVVSTVVCWVCVSSSAWAQTKSLAETETTIPGGTLVLASYFGLAALVFGYLVTLSQRQRRIAADLEGLERRLEQLSEDDEP